MSYIEKFLQTPQKLIYPYRILILKILSEKNDYIRFRDLREILKTTDSNLFSNLRGLEKDSLIESTIKIEGKTPKTYCRITSKGKDAYNNFCNSIIKVMNTDVLTIVNR
jgi:DNA-binding HxlR family transcriptional regulator